MVDVEYVRPLNRFVSLKEIQSYKDSKELKNMMLLKRSRLSVSKVTEEEWDFILSLSEQEIKETAKQEWTAIIVRYRLNRYDYRFVLIFFNVSALAS